MTIDDMDFDDDLSAIDGRENLWREVLSLAVRDAVMGVRIGARDRRDRARLTHEARNYILQYNRDFEEVCSLAGLNPDAVREQVAKQIASAPSPEALAVTVYSQSGLPLDRPGVVANLPDNSGTGAGSTAQETPNITFSGNEACPQ